MNETCVFCKIASREINTNMVFQDDRITAFRATNPQAPVHILIIPNEHIPSLNLLKPEHEPLIGHMVQTAAVIAEREGIAQSGYRVVFNAGPDAGQSVEHVHLHLLGGRRMTWPPG